MLKSNTRPFLLGMILLTWVSGVRADEEASKPAGDHAVFADALAGEDPGPATDPTIVRGRPVEIDVQRLIAPAKRRGGVLPLDLFDGVFFTGIVERVETGAPNHFALMGRLAGEEHGSFALVVNEDVMVANIRAPDRGAYYQIRYLGHGLHVVREIDDSRFPPCATTADMVPPQPVPGPSAGARDRACDDDGSVIDVLVVYTPLARNGAGGTAAMEALIDLAIAESNTAYANSLIYTQLRLVYQGEIDYYEGGEYSDHLYRLRNPADGYMDEVHELRDLYRADMVTLLVQDRQYCGIAYLMTVLSPAFEDHPFNVVTQSCATGDYSFSHELGHNQGCHHDRDNASGPGLYDFSYGYQDPGEVFRTVMAYNCPNGCPRVDHFSNPDVTYSGLTTGVPVGDPASAHNALTINSSALTVANFRREFDCNDNGICDNEDVAAGTSEDCNANGTPDECEFDCNDNAVPDDCDIAAGTSDDCNSNGIPDDCIELEVDCNENDTPDACDVAEGSSRDCNGNGIPDDCEGDCNDNGTSDYCDVLEGTSPDVNGSGYPDECEPPVLFVDGEATGRHNGLTWVDAFAELQDALDVAANAVGRVEEVWVAAGTYLPSAEVEPDSFRTRTFQPINGVAVYGGFAGDETERAQRDWVNHVTILSGDFYGDDGAGFMNYDENAWHVVTTSSQTDETAVLDGFTITGGNADGGWGNGSGGGMVVCGSPTLINLIVADNRADTIYGPWGGGLIIAGDPTLINCSIVRNASKTGAGIFIYDSCNPTMVNCRFFENMTEGCLYGSGGAIYNCGGAHLNLINCVFGGNFGKMGGAIASEGWVTATNCTFIGNLANTGGALCNFNEETITCTNCILWANQDDSGMTEEAQVTSHLGAPVSVDYSCVMGWSGALGGVGNTGADPLFVDADGPDDILGNLDDDVRLSPDSPGIDAGDNDAVLPSAPVDLDGGPRLVDIFAAPDTGPGNPPIVDLGVYEHYLDCNGNGTSNSEDIAAGTSDDCNDNAVPDECEDSGVDCNGNGIWDVCDIIAGTGSDCNGNGTLDECDITGGSSADCDADGTPDECEDTSADCNHNGLWDSCDIAEGSSEDVNVDGFPDECDPHVPLSAPYPHNRARNRYISFATNPENEGLVVTFRIELKSIALGSCSVTGAPCRVELGGADCGACSVTAAPCISPAVDCTPASQSCNPTGETCINDLGGSTGMHWWLGPASPRDNDVHLLVGEPYRQEDLGSAWGPVVHVADCEIVPRAVYGVRAVNVDTGLESAELEVATIARPGNNYWADAVGLLGQYCTGNWAECPDGDSDCPPGESCLEQWAPPDRVVNFNDVTAAVFAFSQVPGMTLPDIMAVDMHGNEAGDANVDPPNFVSNFADIGFIVLAFQGRPYPFSDPADCPDVGSWP